MQLLKQSTASQEVLLGPFLDDTDGKTAETGLTIANTDIKLRLGGGTTFTNKNSGGATHIANGYYSAVLDATDTGTLGLLEICVNASGALPVRHNFTVIHANSYAAMVDGSLVTDTSLADAVHDEVVEGSTTMRQMLRGFAAALMGKASGMATTTAVFRDIGDTKDRITATVTADGDRTAVTRDLT